MATRAKKKTKPRVKGQYDPLTPPPRVGRPKKPETINKEFFAAVERDEFVRAAEYASDPRFKMLLIAMQAPKLRRQPLHRLLERCGLRLEDAIEAWRNYYHHVGVATMMRQVPEVYESVVQDAKARFVPCEYCEGEGSVETKSGKKCWKCEGTGRVRVSGDSTAQKIVLEATGLIGKRAPMIAVTKNEQNNNFLGTLDGAVDVVAGLVKARQVNALPAAEVIDEVEVSGTYDPEDPEDLDSISTEDDDTSDDTSDDGTDDE